MAQALENINTADGALLVVLDIPIGVEFGIDLATYKVGEMFRGIKMIPPGPHFVYTATTNTALRTGFLYYFHPREKIVVREWDKEKEELREYSKSDLQQQILRIMENIQDIIRFLGPYDYEGHSKWQTLTTHISEEVVANIVPLNNVVRTSAEFQSCTDAERPRGESVLDYDNSNTYVKQTEEMLLSKLKSIPESVLRFTSIPPICSRNANPEEISIAHMDCIQSIEKYFAKFQSPKDAIQEVQASFILYLAGYSLDSLAHWRNLLRFFSNSETAIPKYRIFYILYLDILQFQLPELPEELMIASENNIVYKDVGKLISNCHLGGLNLEVEALRSGLADKMSWSFENFLEEDPDELPVIVDLVY